MERLEGAGKHLLNVISDILDLSKIEAGKFELEPKEIELPIMTANLVEMFKANAEKKGLNMSLAVRHVPQWVYGDPTRIQQAMFNFISNAVKFTDVGRVDIILSASAPVGGESQLHFEVRDSGVGIDSDKLGALFEPFVQVDNSSTRSFGGSGLGLVITRRLVTLMGGEVGASSNLGRGSRFWFEIPLQVVNKTAPSEAKDSDEQAINRLRQQHACKRVLVVEDEPINREIILHLLQEAGMTVDLAGDGEVAIERAADAVYDAILMDLQMPRMDGLQATNEMRQGGINQRTPIIALTANAFESDRRQCLSAGMNEVLTKPIDPDRLYKTLLRWLNKAA